jgi:hypothetical protein
MRYVYVVRLGLVLLRIYFGSIGLIPCMCASTGAGRNWLFLFVFLIHIHPSILCWKQYRALDFDDEEVQSSGQLCCRCDHSSGCSHRHRPSLGRGSHPAIEQILQTEV